VKKFKKKNRMIRHALASMLVRRERRRLIVEQKHTHTHTYIHAERNTTTTIVTASSKIPSHSMIAFVFVDSLVQVQYYIDFAPQ
jgi:hypothetical protein